MLYFQDQRLGVKSTIFPDGSNSTHESHHSTNCHTIYLQLPLKNQKKKNRSCVCIQGTNQMMMDHMFLSDFIISCLIYFLGRHQSLLSSRVFLCGFTSAVSWYKRQISLQSWAFTPGASSPRWVTQVWFISLCRFLISVFLLRGFCLLSVCFWSTLLFPFGVYRFDFLVKYFDLVLCFCSTVINYSLL